MHLQCIYRYLFPKSNKAVYLVHLVPTNNAFYMVAKSSALITNCIKYVYEAEHDSTVCCIPSRLEVFYISCIYCRSLFAKNHLRWTIYRRKILNIVQGNKKCHTYIWLCQKSKLTVLFCSHIQQFPTKNKLSVACQLNIFFSRN